MSKKLVAYFSASGVTKKVAQTLANENSADLFEICPVERYTDADLNWRDNQSRSSLEMNDLTNSPKILNQVDNIDQYDIVYLGFPIWWYVEPRIIDTFLDSYDFSGKTIVPFATSGGSGIGNVVKNLEKNYPNLNFKDAKLY